MNFKSKQTCRPTLNWCTTEYCSTKQWNREEKRTIFDQLISKIWGTSISPPDISDHAEHDKIHDPDEDENEPARAMPEFFDPVDDNTNQLLDQHPA